MRIETTLPPAVLRDFVPANDYIEEVWLLADSR
jgi:hypothetical protein